MKQHLQEKARLAGVKKTCPLCNKTKLLGQFDWLPKQDKYHHHCTACTRERVLRLSDAETQTIS